MNADRDVGTFSVPVPSGVTLTNIGFHDVTYHDGDGSGSINFSAADWTAVQGASDVTWSTETQAQNDRANAIRWGTMYSFRFDADAAPVTGSISMGLWRIGVPAAIVGSGDVPGGGGPVTSFCFGSGAFSACPCGNAGAPFHGCENSISTGGAQLSSTGTPSLSNDTLVLTSAGERATALSIFLQGDVEISPVNFGDGLRCADGNLKRLYVKSAVAGSVTAPALLDLSVSAQSAALGDVIPAFGTRILQVYYRDPDAAFCPDPPGSTFNSSNALRVVWSP